MTILDGIQLGLGVCIGVVIFLFAAFWVLEFGNKLFKKGKQMKEWVNKKLDDNFIL